MVVKTVANKSKFKVYIIQNIDRQIDLEDIASALGLNFDELIKEMEAIVFSGTKLNIDYYINNILDGKGTKLEKGVMSDLMEIHGKPGKLRFNDDGISVFYRI